VALNAAIVMGMIGALIGVKRIPKNMIEKLLSFDCTNEENP
jgi:ADP-ribosylglycohydrolase